LVGAGGFVTARPVVPLLIITLLAVSSAAVALRAPELRPATSDPVGKQPLGSLIYQGMNDPRFQARMAHFLSEHGLNQHPLKGDLHGLAPIDAARQVLNDEPRDGRTAAQWLELTKTSNLESIMPASPVRGDLVADDARLAADAGVPYTSTQLAQLRAGADALPADVRAPLGDLVHAMADAWEAQAPIASRVAAMVPNAQSAADLVMSDADREASLQNALHVVEAENQFRSDTAGLFQPTAGPSAHLFQDPEGLVILGGTGNDDYEPGGAFGDAVLIVDPAGDDTYHVSAAGACGAPVVAWFHCNGLVVSTVLDLQGNDSYSYSGAPAPVQGTGDLGAIGILNDVTGHDTYLSSFVRLGGGPLFGFSYMDAGSQGQGLAGVGMLVDGDGGDTIEQDMADGTSSDMYDLSQGFGDAGGVGVLALGGGNNDVLDYGHDIGGSGFQGMYNGGTGMWGGVGIFNAAGDGHSQYHAWDNSSSTDFYAWGFAGFGGTGIFFDNGSYNDFAGVEDSFHNTIEIPLLNCAFGTASYAGLGIFVVLGGHNSYYSDTYSVSGTGNPSDGSVFTQSEGFGGPTEGEGVFVAVNGDDGHFMQAHPYGGPNEPQFTTGRGVTFHGGEGLTGNTAGVYLALGSGNTYTGAYPSQPNAVWAAAGADIATTGTPPTLLPGGL
jgi:hypothetical protein